MRVVFVVFVALAACLVPMAYAGAEEPEALSVTGEADRIEHARLSLIFISNGMEAKIAMVRSLNAAKLSVRGKK